LDDVTRLDVDGMWEGVRVYFTGKVRWKFSAGSGLSNPRTGCTGEHVDSCGVPLQNGAKTTFSDSRKFLTAPIEKTLLLGIKTLHADP